MTNPTNHPDDFSNGAGPARAQSGVILAVPSLADAIAPWRATIPSALGGGVPPHVTLLYPWLPAPTTAGQRAALARVLALTSAVELTFTHLERFPSGVLFLALDQTSAAAVSGITRHLVAGFPSCVPYDGEFPDPHPHLTVALGTHAELDIIEPRAANALAPFLHTPFTVTHATVMQQDQDRLWQQAHIIRLGTID